MIRLKRPAPACTESAPAPGFLGACAVFLSLADLHGREKLNRSKRLFFFLSHARTSPRTGFSIARPARFPAFPSVHLPFFFQRKERANLLGTNADDLLVYVQARPSVNLSNTKNELTK